MAVKLTVEAQNKLTRWVADNLKSGYSVLSNVDYRRGIIKGCLRRGKPCTVYISPKYSKGSNLATLAFDLRDIH